jgi:hypothetical protein
VAAPEIDAGNLKEFAGETAERQDQGLGTGPLSRQSGDAKQKPLEVLIGPVDETVCRGNDWTAN